MNDRAIGLRGAGGRAARLVLGLVAACCAGCCALLPSSARAQFGSLMPSTRFELSDSVQLDLVDGTTLGQFERARAYLAGGQWREAIEVLRRLSETAEGKLIAVTPWRYVPLPDYCQLELASLPPEALRLYRDQIDPIAEAWYTDGVARHDRRRLLDVVEQAGASRWGERALWVLGEMALESGDHTSARWFWQQLVPLEVAPETPSAPRWPSYPGPTFDVAAARARLVLVSILEGSAGRAREELDELARLHPAARGRFGGRDVNYAEALAELLAQSAAWPGPPPEPDWPTFAGNARRNRAATTAPDVGPVAWRRALPPAEPGGQMAVGAVADDPLAPLSYHPVAVGPWVLVNNADRVLAFEAADGKPAFGSPDGELLRDELSRTLGELIGRSETIGIPRFAPTACAGKLYARMGNAVTDRPVESPPAIRPGYLVCLDLRAEGKLVWKAEPEKGWAFDGAPAVDADGLYVALRRGDVRPQAYVACLDAETGRPRWRRFVCAAETPARAVFHQCTSNLLSLDGDRIYFNTNLGAVASLRKSDGKLLWVTLYPRAREVDLAQLAPHWRRDLNPCLVDRGTLLVAPADSPRIFAFDAVGGQMVWQTDSRVEDAVHLLGVWGDRLIASGGRLYWIGLDRRNQGRVLHVWPESDESPGFGRGVLAGGRVYWPARDRIHVFDAAEATPLAAIELGASGLGGGNLLVAGDKLIVATNRELVALAARGGPAAPPPEVAGTAAPAGPTIPRR